MMRNELLEVIKKYVHVDLDAININFERDSGHEILELSVTLPDGKPTAKAESKNEAKTG
jgi:cell division topological specificity factor